MGGPAAYPRVREDHKMTHHDKTKIGGARLAPPIFIPAVLLTELPQPPWIQAS
jgi:hypothetical protein